MIVPEQLSQEKFILLGPKSKDPFPGLKWSEEKNQHAAEKMTELLNIYYPGCNYGVTYTTDLAVLDADNAERLKELGVIDALKDTFIVMSGRDTSVGLHIYLRITNPPTPQKIILTDKENGEPLGDLRLPGSRFYNVGPGCIHPSSGREYQILRDVPIRTLSWDELATVLEPVEWKLREERPKMQHIEHKPNDYNLSVIDFLMPEKAKLVNGEFIGVHPIHGSTTGSNLSVKQDGSVWWCRRCQSGGNWLDALAVAEGIIDCSDAGRQYTKEEWKAINKVLKKIRPDVYEKKMDEWRFLKTGRLSGKEYHSILLRGKSDAAQ